ncbi:hypothetical protein Ade02nite_21320 [Paractinoplanes deccanensis]|uniref:HTH gntR-type domain-containing protein n=1 Tax=Paractinoplanes deccanensis TaxID=113561 RepID=A0ABQ3Y0G0_9ACTN|nr:winged helix-turn-helix domain-containing protein [Actinoplanes deccanensis]GID73491.1 hypothetical protein Ade02nite_21320 [Actinoplanes deccanensis]
MINPQPGATVYEQVAARLRQQIANGTLRPGQVVPSERSLAQEYNIGRQTVSRAVKLLRAEGLLEHRRGLGVFVREPAEVSEIKPPPGSTAVVRMPTPAERSEHEIPEGQPVVVVVQPDGHTTVYPADRCRLRW